MNGKVPVPREVGEYINRLHREHDDDLIPYGLYFIMGDIARHLNMDNAPDVEAENWIIDYSDKFAEAWNHGWYAEEGAE